MRTRTIARGVVVLAVATSCAAPSANNRGPGPPSTFPEMLRAVQFDYDRAPTRKALAGSSAAVVLARLDGVRPGRTIGTSPTDPARGEHLVMAFTVERVVTGRVTPGDTLYVEYPKSQALSADAFDAAAPRGARAALYLVPSRTKPRPGERVFEVAGGPPRGARLWWFTTPQGFVVEHDGDQLAPLQRGPLDTLFPDEPADRATVEEWLP